MLRSTRADNIIHVRLPSDLVSSNSLVLVPLQPRSVFSCVRLQKDRGKLRYLLVDDLFVKATFGRSLQRLKDDSQKYFGASEVTIEPLNYIRRPFSEVLQVNVRNGGQSSRAFIKIAKPRERSDEHLALVQRRVARDFATTTRIYQSLKSYPGLAAVKPIACFPEDLALVTEQVGGETLKQLIERRAVLRPAEKSIEELSNIFAGVGTWLQAFQEVEPTEKKFSLDRLRNYVDDRLVKLVGVDRAGFCEEDRAGVLRYLDARCAEVPERDLREVSIHADFCPENVMIDGSRVILLDFTMAKAGAIYHDLTHMFMHVELLKRKLLYQNRVVNQLQESLLSGYEPGLSPNHPLFEILLLQHIIARLTSMTGVKLRPATRVYQWHLWRSYRKWVKKLSRYGR